MTTAHKFMRNALALLTSACAFAPALAQSSSSAQDRRLLLWHNLRLGMSKAEVKALLPHDHVPLTAGCYMLVSPQYNGNKGLSRVALQFTGRDEAENRCGLVVLKTLHDKYGDPDDQANGVDRVDCGNSYAGGVLGALSKLCEAEGGDKPSYYRYMRWYHDDVEITLKINSNSDNPQWWIVYRPVVSGAEDAGDHL